MNWVQRIFARYPLALWLSRVAKYALSELRGPMIILDSERLSRPGEKMALEHLFLGDHLAQVSLQDSSQQKKLQKAAHVGDDPRDGLTFQTMAGRNEGGDIGRLHLIQRRDIP